MKRLLAWIVPARAWDGFLFDRRTFYVILASEGYIASALVDLPETYTLPKDVKMYVREIPKE